MRRSLYFNNFLATAIVVLISFAMLGGLYSAWNFRAVTAGNRDAMVYTMRQTARYMEAQYLDYELDLSDLSVSRMLAMLSGVSGFSLLISDLNGVIAACSCRDLSHLGMTIPFYDLPGIAEGTVGDIFAASSVSLTTLGSIYPQHRHVASMPLPANIYGRPHVFGYIFVSGEANVFRQEWRQFSGVFFVLALIVMNLTFAVTFIMTKKQAEPLNAMAGAVRRFSRGDFSARVKDFGKIDEISHLTNAFNAMADSLENSEKLRRDFIANVSHELKTPMTVISGFADGILDGTVPPEREKKYLGVISSETKRLSRLVENMMVMASYQTINTAQVLKGRFDIAEVIRVSLLSLESKIQERNLDVSAALPEEPIITQGNKDTITQVVYNLIQNAVKFSASYGKLTVQLWKQGNRAFVSVENQGETIPEEELPHIFDRFHKTDKSRSVDRDGLGLGLYIVKKILDSHNEDIFVTSKDGTTKFMFTLTII